jgi:hypothetical protein
MFTNIKFDLNKEYSIYTLNFITEEFTNAKCREQYLGTW